MAGIRGDKFLVSCSVEYFPDAVIPAQAGIHLSTSAGLEVGPCFRRDDTLWVRRR